jgi:glycine dehydrogenase subunit 1
MSHNFLPHTPEDRQALLATIGVNTVDDLFCDVPEPLRAPIAYQHLPQHGLDELSLEAHLAQFARKNTAHTFDAFLGGGAYQRFIPAAVHTIASRSEFYTAYTPYQPEISQGILQVIYEFQTMIAELTGMDVANASVYDGAHAVMEAALMALRATRKHRVLVLRSVHPDARRILASYLSAMAGMTLEVIDTLPPADTVPNDVACVIVQTPDYFGCLSDLAPVRAFCDAAKALLIVSADPVALGLIEPPRQADIVVGDIQPLGNALNYGGPYGGYMACKKALMRQLPGRLVGQTQDVHGKTCYTLTLQTREQHIRRDKATSNICTNQALNMLKATVYLCLAGPAGLRRVAHLSTERTHHLAEQLGHIPGVALAFPDRPYLFEVALRIPMPVPQFLAQMAEHGILAGVPLAGAYPDLPDGLLVAATEMNAPAALDRYITAAHAVLKQEVCAV